MSKMGNAIIRDADAASLDNAAEVERLRAQAESLSNYIAWRDEIEELDRSHGPSGEDQADALAAPILAKMEAAWNLQPPEIQELLRATARAAHDAALILVLRAEIAGLAATAARLAQQVAAVRSALDPASVVLLADVGAYLTHRGKAGMGRIADRAADAITRARAILDGA